MVIELNTLLGQTTSLTDFFHSPTPSSSELGNSLVQCDHFSFLSTSTQSWKSLNFSSRKGRSSYMKPWEQNKVPSSSWPTFQNWEPRNHPMLKIILVSSSPKWVSRNTPWSGKFPVFLADNTEMLNADLAFHLFSRIPVLERRWRGVGLEVSSTSQRSQRPGVESRRNARPWASHGSPLLTSGFSSPKWEPFPCFRIQWFSWTHSMRKIFFDH